MDLIAQVVAAMLSFLAAIVGNIFAHDICASADSVCTKIIRAAAARLASFDQSPTERDWLLDLREHQTVFEKYRHAVGCYLAAPEMRRFALKELENAPVIEGAPGLVWKRRPNNVWEARWQSSSKARELGYVLKSMKLYMVQGNCVPDEDKDFIVETTRSLEYELDEWLSRDKHLKPRG